MTDAATPLPDRYVTRVDYPAAHRDDGPQMMSYATWTEPPHGVRTMDHAAVYAAADTRVGHSYYGPMTVYVWPHRGDDEHYRTPPPADAYRLDLGDQAAPINPRRHDEPPGAYCSCADPECPTPEGQYTHGPN